MLDGERVVPPSSVSPLRAFELYAQGASESTDEALGRFASALDGECETLRAGWGQGDRDAIRSSGHRIRTLGALARDRAVNEAAARLQDQALTASHDELAAFVAETLETVEALWNRIRG
jgi:hypothetical protein